MRLMSTQSTTAIVALDEDDVFAIANSLNIALNRVTAADWPSVIGVDHEQGKRLYKSVCEVLDHFSKA